MHFLIDFRFFLLAQFFFCFDQILLSIVTAIRFLQSWEPVVILTQSEFFGVFFFPITLITAVIITCNDW